MKYYNLIREDRGEKMLARLEKSASNRQKDLEGISRLSKDKKLADTFIKNVEIIKSFKHHTSVDILNQYLTDDYITLHEALFLLLGIDPMAIAIMYKNIEFETKKIQDELLLINIKGTLEYRKLKKIPKINEDPQGFYSEENDRVYTKGFIDWAIEKQFIKVVTVNEASDNKDDHATQVKYSAWQKQHNTVVALVELSKVRALEKQNNKPEMKVATLLSSETTSFYKNIKDQLVSVYEHNYKLPKAKTLENAISAHNNFKKTTTQD